MSKSKQQIFRAGDSESKLQSASYLNDLLKRIEALEGMLAVAPLVMSTMANGSKALSLGRENPKRHFVELAEDLDAGGEADAYLYTYDTEDRKHEGVTPYDRPLVKVKDSLTGTGGCMGDKGIALEHLESKEKRYTWAGWPIGQGRHIPNYDKDKIQLLGHTADGCLRWYDVLDCDDVEL